MVSGTVNEIEPNGRFRTGLPWRRASLSNTGLLPSSHSKRLPLRVLMSSTLPFSMICLTLRMRSSNSFTSTLIALSIVLYISSLGTRSSSCRTAPGCAIMQLRTCLTSCWFTSTPIAWFHAVSRPGGQDSLNGLQSRSITMVAAALLARSNRNGDGHRSQSAGNDRMRSASWAIEVTLRQGTAPALSTARETASIHSHMAASPRISTNCAGFMLRLRWPYPLVSCREIETLNPPLNNEDLSEGQDASDGRFSSCTFSVSDGIAHLIDRIFDNALLSFRPRYQTGVGRCVMGGMHVEDRFSRAAQAAGRTALTSSRICSGVVPQQPPMILIPISAMWRKRLAIQRGSSS